jgi:hypothetical protein
VGLTALSFFATSLLSAVLKRTTGRDYPGEIIAIIFNRSLGEMVGSPTLFLLIGLILGALWLIFFAVERTPGRW